MSDSPSMVGAFLGGDERFDLRRPTVGESLRDSQATQRSCDCPPWKSGPTADDANSSRPRPVGRQAFTLIEMIATLSILLVLAVAASRMLGSITEIGLGHRDSIRQRTTVLRFAQSLRGDVGESVGIATSDEGWPLELVSPDQRVEYRWNPESKRLLRTVRSSSDGEAMGRVVARDVYPLGKRVEPRVVVSEDQVSVILRTPSAGPTWIVEAPR